MNEPVDLSNLRSMTDGDEDIEKALFEEFMASFETGIVLLQGSTHENAAETWRKEAHALKGIALNLGAEKLGAFCRQAQDSCAENMAEKDALLENIAAEYQTVKIFLLSIYKQS